MISFVVDASVAIKWFLEEDHSREALSLLASGNTLSAPELILSECGNILWKRTLRGELTDDRALEILDTLQDSPLIVKPTAPLLTTAFAIASRYQRSVYDSLYLALAVAMEAPLVTADLRLFNAIRSTSLSRSIVWIGDYLP